ncbi:AEC family transporter [Rhodobacter capsulatus]|uniref:Membrane transport family protein n=1 Tax=Rhodobacter capsulatus (strain ATCC BAA-309 / NBRC 16581 / SB1003) TaxID=272942 RepID=D5ASU8_RHOCB|nr:AEC family transporter [Rhodobacter capsulatus]ADE87189.1 membrane transport family protein [Rhodobacter capsulatus SB 1003]ETD03416.1 malate transporter [Rhodobacter capsulatus DE442]ETD80211.1 malate transporter [Rhodobacter capsulatus R121]ETE55475.1 malate transporter [Rhodobacter capsulatus Y262]MDS0925286.1 AEC family transporter [Rhodobacter capsulatus]
MIEIFLKTLPFFALIGLGWAAGRLRFFPPEATAWLTKFVFYFALSAMLFRFTATLPIAELFDPAFFAAYLTASIAVWVLGFAVAKLRARPLAEAAMEAHTAMTGNTGFLGVPMLVVLLGPKAAGPVLMVLAADMIVFSTLITLIVTYARQGRVAIGPLAMGLAKNPMIVSMLAGLAWALVHLPMPGPLEEFMKVLGGAATPGALFAIGASLAGRAAETFGPALWLSAAKLVLHPLAVAIAAFLIFPVEPFAAGVMVAAAALPVAGNVYILAAHFGVAPQRVSTAILISTAVSILSIPAVIAWVHT